METILKTENLSKRFGQKLALDNVCMSINKGDIYGFIGKNGAGKTTFMRCVLGMANPSAGKIDYIKEHTVGSLIEAPGLYPNCTAYENLRRFSILAGGDKDSIPEVLRQVGLADVGKKKVKNFSLGMKQRLGIAVALLGDPDFLILDEPVNGLDPAGIKEIRDLIISLNKEQNITFLISSHLLDELSRVVTKYGIINDGRLIEEVTADELSQRCRQSLSITVDDPNRACELLKEALGADEMEVNEGRVTLYSHIDEGAEINRLLSRNGLLVSGIEQRSENLEEYFMERIGDQ